MQQDRIRVRPLVTQTQRAGHQQQLQSTTYTDSTQQLPQPQQLQVQQASGEPTLLTSVILTSCSFGAQAKEMSECLVAHSCAGTHTHAHAPLHARLPFDWLPLLQPEGSEVWSLPVDLHLVEGLAQRPLLMEEERQ